MTRNRILGSCLLVMLSSVAAVAQGGYNCTGPILDSRALWGVCALSGSVCFDCWGGVSPNGGYNNCSFDWDGNDSCPQPGIPGPYPILTRQEPLAGTPESFWNRAVPSLQQQAIAEAVALAQVAEDPTVGTLVAGHKGGQDSPILSSCSDSRLFDRLALVQSTFRNAATR